MAAAVGVRPAVVSAGTYFATGAVTGVTGVLIGVKFSSMNVGIWEGYLVLGFVIATVGGLGSILGTAVAAFAVGLISQLLGHYQSQAAVTITIYLLLFITLFIRPSGLFGRGSAALGVART